MTSNRLRQRHIGGGACHYKNSILLCVKEKKNYKVLINKRRPAKAEKPHSHGVMRASYHGSKREKL